MKNKDRFDTRCWRYGAIAHPGEVIAELFSLAAVFHFRNMIGKLLYYAGEDRIFRQRSPADVLLYMKAIRSLIIAAHALKGKKSPIITNLPPCTEPQSWREFPRFLSPKEVRDPHRVFRKFFKYQSATQWVKDWEELVEAALSRNRGDLDVNLVAAYRWLVKLVEASHLVSPQTKV